MRQFNNSHISTQVSTIYTSFDFYKWDMFYYEGNSSGGFQIRTQVKSDFQIGTKVMSYSNSYPS